MENNNKYKVSACIDVYKQKQNIANRISVRNANIFFHFSTALNSKLLNKLEKRKKKSWNYLQFWFLMLVFNISDELLLLL